MRRQHLRWNLGTYVVFLLLHAYRAGLQADAAREEWCLNVIRGKATQESFVTNFRTTTPPKTKGIPAPKIRVLPHIRDAGKLRQNGQSLRLCAVTKFGVITGAKRLRACGGFPDVARSLVRRSSLLTPYFP